MIQRKSGFYVCPPAFQNFVNNKIDLVEYHLSELYKTDSLDASKDYRINGEIGAGFYHTFCDIESAQNFAKKINEKILNPNTSKYPELYKIPDGAQIVILNAHIPQGSLYYEGFYQGKKIKSAKKLMHLIKLCTMILYRYFSHKIFFIYAGHIISIIYIIYK